MTEQRIADEAGIPQRTVSRYLDAAQISHVADLPPEQVAAVEKLPVKKRAALSKLMAMSEPKEPRRQTPSAKAKRARRKRSEQHLPAVAEVTGGPV
jgi:hypothetical protein